MYNHKINIVKALKLGLKVGFCYLTNKRVSKQDIGYSYSQVSQRYQDTYLKTMHIYNEQILDQLVLNTPQGSILDLAGGTGFNSVYLKNKNNNYHIDLIDISQDMLNQCPTTNIQLICDSMLHYLNKQNENSYDGIICTWALMYEKPQTVMKECYRVLKPCGYLYILVNDKKTLPQIRKIYPYLLVQYVNQVHKLMLDLPTPRNKKMLYKWGQMNHFECQYIQECKQDFYFESFQEAANFVTSTGALAGYDVMLDLKQQDIFNSLTDLLKNNETNPCITHHFIKAIFKKEETI